MTPEMQSRPFDPSDYSPLSARELLRRSVINLAKIPEDDPTSNVLKWGCMLQKGARFLIAQITSESRLVQDDGDEPLLDHVLELYACDSSGNKIKKGERKKDDGRNQTARGSFQILKLSSEGVIGIIDGQEITFDNTPEGKTAEEEFIQRFYADNRLNDIPRLRATLRTI